MLPATCRHDTPAELFHDQASAIMVSNQPIHTSGIDLSRCPSSAGRSGRRQLQAPDRSHALASAAERPSKVLHTTERRNCDGRCKCHAGNNSESKPFPGRNRYFGDAAEPHHHNPRHPLPLLTEAARAAALLVELPSESRGLVRRGNILSAKRGTRRWAMMKRHDHDRMGSNVPAPLLHMLASATLLESHS